MKLGTIVQFLPHYLEESRAVTSRVAGRDIELALYVLLTHLRVGHRARDQIDPDAAPSEQLDAAPGADVIRSAEYYG